MRTEYEANLALQRKAHANPHRTHAEIRKENSDCLSFLVVFILACALGAALACNL